MSKVLIGIGAVLAVVVIFGVTSYNGLVNNQESVDQQWAQVQTVYQRRLDLIPNLVATVKGYAKHEHDTLLAVTKARQQVTQIDMKGLTSNPQQFKKYMQAQAQVRSSLSKLLVVVERYPDLKASQNFMALQNELEGTENRISVERHRYNDVAKQYDTRIRQFPRIVIARLFDFKQKPYYQAETQAAAAPKVQF